MTKANQEALAQLRDIHLPSPIHWWPVAPGWYFVLIISVILMVTLIYFIHKKNVQARPKKQALRLLAVYTQDYEKGKNSQLTSARISELLRRVALVYFPRVEVASLHGEEWIDFLNRTSKGIDFQPLKPMLLDSPFKLSETVNLNGLIIGAKSWIAQRRESCLN